VQTSLFTRLAVVEAELLAMREVLAQLNVNQDEPRHDRDEWRWRAERLLADAALRRAGPCPIPNAPIPLRDLGPPLASIADPAEVPLHKDEVGLQAVGAAQRLSPFISTECERP
jgi:hypothetical protein